jgi:hypothetical protein
MQGLGDRSHEGEGYRLDGPDLFGCHLRWAVARGHRLHEREPLQGTRIMESKGYLSLSS